MKQLIEDIRAIQSDYSDFVDKCDQRLNDVRHNIERHLRKSGIKGDLVFGNGAAFMGDIDSLENNWFDAVTVFDKKTPEDVHGFMNCDPCPTQEQIDLMYLWGVVTTLLQYGVLEDLL